MARKKSAVALNIYLNGAPVGVLVRGTRGEISFRYSNEWLEDGMAISNSLPLQESEYRGEVVSRYFDNLLPDNDEIKKNIATKFGAESTRPFDLLEVIGKDCVGALSFLPDGMDPDESFELKADRLTEQEIALKLKGLSSSNPLGMDRDDFRISIAGAQEKTAFLKLEDGWYGPRGLTPTTHIFKTSIGALGVDLNFEDSIDNEWASLMIMRKMGLTVCSATIEMFEDQKVLAVERFDRRWREYEGRQILLRVPQEDMCQALNVSPYQKYQSEGGPGIVDIGKLLMASKNSDDRLNFFKAIMVFDLLYATDGHAKNFSLFVERDGFRLTPIYDVMSGYFLHKREGLAVEKLKLAMNVGNSGHYSFKRVRLKHYQESAKLCGINVNAFEQIVDELKSAYVNLHICDEELPLSFSNETLGMILEGMKKRISRL